MSKENQATEPTESDKALPISVDSLLEAGNDLVTAIEAYFDGNDRRPTMQICSAVKEWREAKEEKTLRTDAPRKPMTKIRL